MQAHANTLCVANGYEKKYYLSEDFSLLPEPIRQELKIMCVLFTEKVGGILTLYFNDEGELMLETASADHDFFYDDIGAALDIKRMQQEKAELMESLEMFYRVFFLEEGWEDDDAAGH
ncbi:MAG: DUF6145 family protein [Lachnospiraceae bacterium]|nr:DUF6145 family protein [Lachnospiraceae bacterium]MDY5742562.1 DUF6145 family protein [Lachnospiraceae bacterium]